MSVSNKEEPKFIVVDQSLRDVDGHYFTYSGSVAQAAARRGFESIILAHRRFDRRLQPENVQVLPWFHLAWYEPRKLGLLRSLVFPILALFPPRPRDRIRIFLRRVSRRFRARKSLGASATQKPAQLALFTFHGTSKPSVGMLSRFVAPMFYELARTAVRAIPALPRKERGTSDFGAMVLGGLSQVGAKNGDRALIHTLSVGELESLIEALLTVDLDGVPHFHILLRQDPRVLTMAHGGRHGIAACLRRFHACRLWPRYATFFTDTEELSVLYNVLSPIQFTKAPIPVRQDLFHDEPRDRPATLVGENRSGPVKIAYLGNAREEKGYHHLPDMVAALWADYLAPGKARFTIQSHFNVPGGEPHMASAQMRLTNYPDQAVALMTSTMSEGDYYAVLESIDAMVLPYDPKAYAARSSHIFAQALAAGKPVIVPAATWMASQIDTTRGQVYESSSDLPAAVANVIDDINSLTKGAEGYKHHWRRLHSPDALLNCLIQQPASTTLETTAHRK